jgi:hypothetical protein
MGTARRGSRVGAALAVTGGAAALLALLASGGCEFVVSDAIPSFTCVPGAAANCPTGEVCVPSTHVCVSQAGTCTPGAATGCAAGMHCNDQTLRCTGSPASQDAAGDGMAMETFPDSSGDTTVSTPDGRSADASGDAADGSLLDALPNDSGSCGRGVTCGCTGPADCDSGVCADTLTATTALSNELNGMSFCTQPCCTSTDCPGTTVCFGTGGGGNYCVNPSWIGRTGAPASGAMGGAMCTSNGQCRSGVCDMTSGQCADTCCSTTNQGSECAAGTICRYAAFPGNSFDTHQTAWCGPQIGSSAAGATCVVDASCQSGKCATTFTPHCEAVCRSSTDCVTAGQACSYGLGPTLPANKDIVAGCVSVTGNVANGGGCTTNSDCLSAFCDNLGKCRDVCATEGDCKGGLHCKPVVVMVQGSYSVLACEM